MRQIDNMTQPELDTLYLKGMLTTNKLTKNTMPKTITLKRRAINADKKHSVVFVTSDEQSAEVVDSIYIKRPFADNVNSITMTVTRDIDAKLNSL